MRMHSQFANLARLIAVAGFAINLSLPTATSAGQMPEQSDPGAAKPAASGMPATAPDLVTSKSPAVNRYVKQMAVMDTPTADSASAQKTKPAAAPRVIKNDVDLLDSLAPPGWESPPAFKLTAENKMLMGPDGKAVYDVQGKNSAVLAEYHCTEVAVRHFRRGDLSCELDLFRFASADGAYGVYSTMRAGSSTVLMRGQGNSEDENSITFYSGNALAFLHSVSDGDDEAKSMMGHLADQIAKRLPVGQTVPRMISAMPYMDKVTASEKFFMGSQAAMRYGNVQFSDALLLDQSRGAACADYQYSRPMAERLKLMLVEYPNQSVARSAFSSYTSTMTAYAHKTLDKNDSQTLCKMAAGFLMCGVMGSRVFVISGAKRATSPSVLARQLVPGAF
jgi:hypothetical protein